MMTQDDPPSPMRRGGRGRGAGGWAPAFGEARQKDQTRANARAKSLRSDQTESEKKLWRLLQQLNKEGAHFRRQVAIDHLVFDFGDYSARLLVELDGAIHRREDVTARDAHKGAVALRAGFKFLRLENRDVWDRPDWVVDRVRAVHGAPHPQPPPRQGEGA